MSLCIYSGGDTGFEEKERILDCLRELPAREYTVIVNAYYNRANNLQSLRLSLRINAISRKIYGKGFDISGRLKYA